MLRYLKTSCEVGIVYQGPATGIKAYSDADWGSNLDDRRSVTDVVVKMNGGPVDFKSKYQRTVTLSAAEVEYMALSLYTPEVIWTRVLLNDMGHEQVGGNIMGGDNQRTIALASNAGNHARTKHIDIRNHFIRDKVAAKVNIVNYVENMHQLADLLTTPRANRLASGRVA
jgi:hypothetical protein